MVACRCNVIQHYNAILGCLMDNIQHSTGLVKADKLESYVECGKRCNVESECVTWTYVESICYLKTDNTFRQRNKYRSCGIKNCTGSSKYSF